MKTGKKKPISITTSTQFPTPIYSFALKLRRKMQSFMPKGNSHDPQDSELQGCCFISSVLSTTLSTAANSAFINIQLLTRFQRLFPGVSQRANMKRIEWLRCFNDGQVVVQQTSPVFLHYLDLSAWHLQQLGGSQSFLQITVCFCFSYLKMPFKINTLSFKKKNPSNH